MARTEHSRLASVFDSEVIGAWLNPLPSRVGPLAQVRYEVLVQGRSGHRSSSDANVRNCVAYPLVDSDGSPGLRTGASLGSLPPQDGFFVRNVWTAVLNQKTTLSFMFYPSREAICYQVVFLRGRVASYEKRTLMVSSWNSADLISYYV